MDILVAIWWGSVGQDMMQPPRRAVGRVVTAEFVKQGFELIDDQDCFLMRHPLTAEANLLVYVGPYEILFPKGVRVDVKLGLQYLELQRLWKRLLQREPNEPSADWSVLSVTEKWCPESERVAWIYPAQRNLDQTPVARAIVDAVMGYGLPYCAEVGQISDLPAALEQELEEGEPRWGCDRSYVLPLALWMIGKREEANRKARAFLQQLETAPRKPHTEYVDAYKRFVANLATLRSE